MIVNDRHNDAQLIKKLRQGEKAAFEKIYYRYHGNLYFYALKFVKSSQIAEEIVQEVFLKIWEIRRDIRPELSLMSFLFTICKHRVLNVLDRAATDLSFRQEIAKHVLTSANSVEDSITAREYQEIIDCAVSKLPPIRQIVFNMCRVEGKSYDDVAVELGIKKGTVKDHMVKAIRFVKDYISEHAEISFLVIFCLTN